MIDPQHLQSSLDALWRRSGDSPPEHEVAVVTAAQLARMYRGAVDDPDRRHRDRLQRAVRFAAALEDLVKRVRGLELTISQRDLV